MDMLMLTDENEYVNKDVDILFFFQRSNALLTSEP